MLRLALTPGEPAGIGPDLALQLVAEKACPKSVQCVLIADQTLLLDRAADLGLTINEANLPIFSADTNKAGFSLLPMQAGSHATAGTPQIATAPYVLSCLERAANGCLKGEFQAMVTGPVHKAIINEAGIAFTGHTEFLANLALIPKVVMMLVSGDLRVALATTHLPLRQVPDAITKVDLLQTLAILDRELSCFFTNQRPRIGVCGLNPHAGEDGHLGTEEINSIRPAIKQASKNGLQVSGPWPADTVFTAKHLQDHDVILAMYHDQGLPVLKYAGFGQAVNVTLGLPFIRTSVDHGTAFDLAGTGSADAGSLKAALKLAVDMGSRQQGNTGGLCTDG